MVMKGKATTLKPSICSQRTDFIKWKAAYGSYSNTCEQISDKARSRKRHVTFSEVKKKEPWRKAIKFNYLPGFCPIGYSSITFDKLLDGNKGGDTVFNAAHWWHVLSKQTINHSLLEHWCKVQDQCPWIAFVVKHSSN